MKFKRLIKIIIISVFTISTLLISDCLLNQSYIDQLRDIHAQFIPQNSEKVTKTNYKKLTYERVVLPGGASDAVVTFETIHFVNDSIAIVDKIHKSADRFLYLRELLNINRSYHELEKFVLRNDTLFSMESFISGRQLYFPFKFQNDSLIVGFYNFKN